MAAGSPYEVLGIESTASQEDVRSAFRRVALQMHPDVNKQDGADAEFMACKAAYDTLSNTQLRQAYDLANSPVKHDPAAGAAAQQPPEPSGSSMGMGTYVRPSAWAYEPAPASGRTSRPGRPRRSQGHGGRQAPHKGAAGTPQPQRWSDLRPLLQAYLLEQHGVHIGDFASLQDVVEFLEARGAAEEGLAWVWDGNEDSWDDGGSAGQGLHYGSHHPGQFTPPPWTP